MLSIINLILFFVATICFARENSSVYFCSDAVGIYRDEIDSFVKKNHKEYKKFFLYSVVVSDNGEAKINKVFIGNHSDVQNHLESEKPSIALWNESVFNVESNKYRNQKRILIKGFVDTRTLHNKYHAPDSQSEHAWLYGEKVYDRDIKKWVLEKEYIKKILASYLKVSEPRSS